MISTRALLTTVAVVATLADAGSALAMRCGTHLVLEGDTRDRVRHLCGAPTDVAVRVEAHTVHEPHGHLVVSRTVTRVIESWTLNFGPQEFMRLVVFHDGVVARIETLRRGYRPEQLGAYGRDIEIGDTRDRVRAVWGEPSEASSHVADDTVHAFAPPGLASTERRTVEVDTWTFNYGPRRFMRRVVFEDGRVVRIETLGRGY